jgi:activator of HSP90 ATPase
MSDQFELHERFALAPEVLYRAWLDSAEHGAMTGSLAEIDPKPGGGFSAWDEYILGTTLELVENQRIVQRWRTTEFAEGDADSRLEITFQAEGNETVLTIRHTEIPDGQGDDYRQGWRDSYFIPMHEYLGG